MTADKEVILLSAFTALEIGHLYSAVNPSIMTIRKFAQEPDARRAIREGEAIASGYGFLLAVVVSMLAQSSWPLVFGAMAIVAMVLVYEWALTGQSISLPGWVSQ